jgi:CRISPR-associated endonuclease/helicase Cas3
MSWDGFAHLFKSATGYPPYPYQMAYAESPKTPEVLVVPTGAGKTAAVLLGWLWRRRFHPDPATRDLTPRRLVYCLPMRVLVEQTHSVALQYIERLGLTEEVGLHPLLGGSVDDDWSDHPDRDCVIIGTQDMLLSRALNRGYGASRFRWPRLFGLLHNDVQWAFDEVQLMGVALSTGAQLEGLRRAAGTVGFSQSVFLSATFDPSWINTVDFEIGSQESVLRLGPDDYGTEPLGRRLHAGKTLQKAPLETTATAKEIARFVAETHRAESRPSGLTLVIMNQVDSARDVYRSLSRASDVPAILLHSQFRPPDRATQLSRLLGERGEEGLIAVTTQVVEAGLDLDAAAMIFQLCPWPSVVQRLGRCNRAGNKASASAYWLDVKEGKAAPYDEADLIRARQKIQELGDGDASPSALEKLPLDPLPAPRHVVRRRDVYDLFDTSTDISGLDIDVSRFIRSIEERDVLVYWRPLDGKPNPAEPPPQQKELCNVPIDRLRRYLKEGHRSAWSFDHLEGRWVSVRGRGLRPGMRLLLEDKAGGYAPESGFDERLESVVPPVPPGPVGHEAGAHEEEGMESDPVSVKRPWVTLRDHSDHVAAEAARLADLIPEHKGSLVLAARWHDAGKAHPVFQRFLRRTAGEPPGAGELYAKSPGSGGRHERRHFRHELASGLLLLQTGGNQEADLAAYLAASHHGKVRMTIRSLPGEDPPPSGGRHALGIWDGEAVPAMDLGGGVLVPETEIDLSVMDLGTADGEPSWTERAARLLEQLGPFRLAYLESLVRAADIRASREEERNG